MDDKGFILKLNKNLLGDLLRCQKRLEIVVLMGLITISEKYGHNEIYKTDLDEIRNITGITEQWRMIRSHKESVRKKFCEFFNGYEKFEFRLNEKQSQ